MPPGQETTVLAEPQGALPEMLTVLFPLLAVTLAGCQIPWTLRGQSPHGPRAGDLVVIILPLVVQQHLSPARKLSWELRWREEVGPAAVQCRGCSTTALTGQLKKLLQPSEANNHPRAMALAVPVHVEPSEEPLHLHMFLQAASPRDTASPVCPDLPLQCVKGLCIPHRVTVTAQLAPCETCCRNPSHPVLARKQTRHTEIWCLGASNRSNFI